MTRTALMAATALGLALAAPSFGSHGVDPAQQLAEARAELAHARHLAAQVREPGTRRALDRSLARAELLVYHAEHELSPAHHGLTVEEALAMIRQESFEQGKLHVIERVARNGSFTSTEIRTLVSTLSFDSSRIEALVALYPAAIDPHRYDFAMGALQFSSSRRQVEQRLGL